MKKLLLILLFIHVGISKAQIVDFYVWRTNIDSLVRIIKTYTGTRRVDELNELSRYIVLLKPDSSLRLARQALAFSRAIGYPAGHGVAILNIGNYYYYEDDKLKALEYYFAALPLLEPTEPSRGMGMLMFHLGLLNSYLMNYDRAKNSLYRALSNFRAKKDSAAIIDVYFYLWDYYIGETTGTDHSKPVELDSAFIRNEVILSYCRRHPDADPGYFTTLYCTNRKGGYYLERKDPQAIKIYEHSLELGNKIGRSYTWGSGYLNLGSCYYQIYNDEKKALMYYTRTLKETKNPADLHELYPEAYILLSEIHIKYKKYQKALECLHKARLYIDDALQNEKKMEANLHAKLYFISALKESRIRVDSMLSLVYWNLGDFRKGLLYNNFYYQGKDSLLMDKTNLKVSLMQAGMEVENARNKAAIFAQESKVKALQLTQTRLISGAAALVIIVSALLFVSWFRRKRLKSEQKTVALEQKLLRSQMNPHFIFNSLASIQNFIYKEKREDAGEYLSRFSRLVRNILDNSREEFVPLEKEIETITHYLELQKLRYAGKFVYHIQTDPGIDPENTWIPPMLAQPFIENSIEHGIKHKVTTGKIEIRFNLENDLIRFEVEDDGVGREKAREIEFYQNQTHKPLATSITQERLSALNKKLRTKIEMEIIDLKNALGEATGTKVTFGIPLGR